MKTPDLRRQQVTLEELLQYAAADSVLILNRNGDEFLLEPRDAFDREAAELGRSAKFMAFLNERSKEPGTSTLDEIESRLSNAEQTTDE